MRTQAILVLPFFMLILLVAVSSADNQTDSTTLSELTPSSKAPGENLGSSIDSTMTTVENVSLQNDTTNAPTSPSLPASTSPTTSQLNKFSSSTLAKNTTPQPINSTNSTNSKTIIFVIILVIVVFFLFVGFLLVMRGRHSGQDSSVPRLLLSVRERLRTVIRSLEDRIRPGANRGGQDDETEGRQREEGQTRDLRGGGAFFGVTEGAEEHKQEESSSSDDYSSMEGDNLQGKALSRREEEEMKQSGNADGEETSSASEGDRCALEGESSGDKKGGSEEIALVSSPQEDDQKADLSDVTIL